jgi:AcrR family transcriptional regulator
VGKQAGRTAERIKEAAVELFGARGLKAVTVDDIAARANVTKRTVYCHFRSKDDLIEACLSSADLETRVLDIIGLEPSADLEHDLRRVFSAISELCRDVRWTGAAFVRPAVEMAGLPGHPAAVGARRHQSHTEETLRRRLELLGLAEPERLARRLLVLLDGAIVHGLIHHDPRHVDEAGRLAVELVAAARRDPDRSRYAALPFEPATRRSERRISEMQPARVMPR